MKVFRIGRKVVLDAVLLNSLGKRMGLSFKILEKVVEGDRVSVLVRGELPLSFFRKQVDEEWVEIDVKLLAEQFCVEKYGTIPDHDSLEFRREYLRAKLVATRYAVGLAKKRIEDRFAGREFRDAMERELEEVELLNIYSGTERFRREESESYLRRVKELYPHVYEEIRRRFKHPERVVFRTEGQSRRIHELVRKLGLKEEEYRELLRRRFGVSSSLALSKEEASELIGELQKLRKT